MGTYSYGKRRLIESESVVYYECGISLLPRRCFDYIQLILYARGAQSRKGTEMVTGIKLLAVCLTLVGVAVLLCGEIAVADFPYRTVALSGTQAPGCPDEALFEVVLHGLVDDVGHVVFGASLVIGDGGVDSGNNTGLWVEDGTGVSLVIRQGDPAPGLPSDIFFGDPLSYSILGVNGSSQIVLASELQDANRAPIQTHKGNVIWHFTGGTAEVLVRGGDQVADGPAGWVYEQLQPAPINNSGKIAFSSVYGLPGAPIVEDRCSLWSNRGGTFQMLLTNGDPAPGAPVGSTFRGLPGGISMNDAGQIAFTASVDSPAGRTVGLWTETDGTVSCVVYQGQRVPGTSDGSVFTRVSTGWGSSARVPINSSGQVSFAALYSSPTGTEDSIWLHDGGVSELIARTSDPAPGTPDGALFGAFSDPVAIDDTGAIAFVGSLKTGTGGVDSAVQTSPAL